MLSLLAPGQGSQFAGMLTPWLNDPSLATFANELATAADLDLIQLGTEAPIETITDTRFAQPLIVAASLLSHAALAADGHTTDPDEAEQVSGAGPGRVAGRKVGLVAGHSVGELAALAIAGVITPAEAVRLAAIRGAAMAEAAAASPTSMSAVVGGVREEVLAAIEASGASPANFNAAAQVVAAGTAEQLAALAENPPARARVIPLTVAGAFHTHHMAPAQETFAKAVSEVEPSDPTCILLSNYDGVQVTSGREALDRLVEQIVNPVRWDACMATMAERGVSAIVELAPGGVLSGLAKRELKGIPAAAITTPDSITAALEVAQGDVNG